MVFPVIMYGSESWTIKQAELWEINASELWYWRRPLTVPWTARRSNQSILKQISPGCSLQGLMLKLKLQYFNHLTQRADSFEKIMMLGKIEGRRRMGRQRMRWLHGITDSMEISLSKVRSWWWTGRPGMLRFMGSQRVGHNWATELIWNVWRHIYILMQIHGGDVEGPGKEDMWRDLQIQMCAEKGHELWWYLTS